MNFIKRVLCVGPCSKIVTGQSFSFMTFTENSRHKITRIDTNTLGCSRFGKVTVAVTSFIKMLMCVLSCRFDYMYITTSRSRVGLLKDSYFICVARALGINVVNHLHGADFIQFYESLNLIEQTITRYVYRKISTSIVLMEGMKEQYALFPSMHIVVVPNFFPKEFGGYKFHENSGAVPKLLFFSNLMKSKGVVELLEAVEILNRQGIEILLDFAGHFLTDHLASAAELEEVFNRFKPENVRYLGPMTGAEKARAFQEADIFLLPTYYPTEAFPLTIVEALAMGCYIITTRHNYIPELISIDNGALVEPGSAEDLAVAIKAAISDRDRLFNVRIHNYYYARELYSQDQYVNRIDDIFSEQIKGQVSGLDKRPK